MYIRTYTYMSAYIRIYTYRLQITNDYLCMYIYIRMYACHTRKNVRFRKQEQRPPINLEEGGARLSFYVLRELKNSNWEYFVIKEQPMPLVTCILYDVS